jgi:hypothetical protein
MCRPTSAVSNDQQPGCCSKVIFIGASGVGGGGESGQILSPNWRKWLRRLNQSPSLLKGTAGRAKNSPTTQHACAARHSSTTFVSLLSLTGGEAGPRGLAVTKDDLGSTSDGPTSQPPWRTIGLWSVLPRAHASQHRIRRQRHPSRRTKSATSSGRNSTAQTAALDRAAQLPGCSSLRLRL